MSLFINKCVKTFFTLLTLILFLGIILTQITAYIIAVHFKNEMIAHDYELAGYLSAKHPEPASGIQSVFTSEKSKHDFETGKALLEQAGYKNSMQLRFMPKANEIYKTNAITNFIVSVLTGFIMLLLSYLFLKAHYKKIDRLNDDVNNIMNGEIAARLDDNEEGSLSRLAASINNMTSSLHTHIEKEKHNRVFLKDVLTNVSHQLKTPLSALTMYTEIMKDEHVDNETVKNFLNKSENELERMQTLISNLLKLAKLDAGIIQLHISGHVLNDIIKQAAQSFETGLLKEQKSFELKAVGKVSYPCDKEWMLEALSNLIKNAAEHTAAGNRIEARIEETPLMVNIIVRDNGEGIHPDDLNHIFKRFYRSRFSRNKQGTGIGLTLAKTVIEMHGGFISVESAMNKGAAFTIHLPRLTKL